MNFPRVYIVLKDCPCECASHSEFRGVFFSKEEAEGYVNNRPYYEIEVYENHNGIGEEVYEDNSK